MPMRIVLVVLAELLALPVVLTVSPVSAQQRSRTITRTFRNATLINIPASSRSSMSVNPSPSLITVGGLLGKSRDVHLTLNPRRHP